MTDVVQLVRDERAELADLLESMSPEQWEAPTLCEQWRVRDVVAHILSYEGVSRAALARRFVQARFLPDRVNSVGVSEYDGRSPAELVELLRAHLTPQGLTAGFGGRIALLDGLIHQQDIRRPLGLPRKIAPERLRAALPLAVVAPPIRGFWHVRGVRLVATDLEWSSGRGPEVHGPGEALLMVIGGRRGVAQELTGPGADILLRRLG